MAPPSADTYPITTGDGSPAKSTSASRLSGPLIYSGSLDEYESFDLTPVIGREFSSTLQLSEILHDDAKIRDLGTIGRSGRLQPYLSCELKTVPVKKS
jgi:hypothetical protein